MLTFEEKLAIIETFPELSRRKVSLGRVNFHYEESALDKKIVVYHLHPNGNGFVYAGLIDGYETDDRGFANIRDYSETDLRKIITASIQSLHGEGTNAPESPQENTQEIWSNTDNQTLELIQQDEMWYVYANSNVENIFETYEEAVEYLAEEGFRKQH